MYNYDKINNQYYAFLKKGSYNWSTENIDTQEKKRQYHEILNELVDLSYNYIQCLSEEETKILRQYLGIHEKAKTLAKISESLGKTDSQITTFLNKIAETLRNRINRGVVSLKEAYLNGEITKEELLEAKLRYIDYPYDIRIINGLIRSGYDTIGKLIESSISDIRWSRNTTDRSMKELLDYIHSLGLLFKNESHDLEGIRNIVLDNYLNNQKTNINLSEVDKQITECDEVIKTLIGRKEKLEEIKRLLLETQKQTQPQEYTIGIK